MAIAYAEDAAGTRELPAELSKDGRARTAGYGDVRTESSVRTMVEETRDAIGPLPCARLKPARDQEKREYGEVRGARPNRLAEEAHPAGLSSQCHIWQLIKIAQFN